MAGVLPINVLTGMKVVSKRSNPCVEHRGDGEPCLYGDRQNRTPASSNYAAPANRLNAADRGVQAKEPGSLHPLRSGNAPSTPNALARTGGHRAVGIADLLTAVLACAHRLVHHRGHR
jgi:hypothetical protein